MKSPAGRYLFSRFMAGPPRVRDQTRLENRVRSTLFSGRGSVVLAISAEKEGNLRVVYARIGRCQGRPAWQVLKLRWRGPTLPLRVTLG